MLCFLPCSSLEPMGPTVQHQEQEEEVDPRKELVEEHPLFDGISEKRLGPSGPRPFERPSARPDAAGALKTTWPAH